jgi:hypothetical protein
VSRRRRHSPSAVLASAVSVEFRAPWSGLCPVGVHGLDFEGQSCDACAASELTEAQLRKIGALKAKIAERAAWLGVWSSP